MHVAEMTMMRRIIHHLPTREAMLASRWLAPFAERLAHPRLWHVNRHSLARGVALGLFIGFIVPLGQTPLAALLSMRARANLLVAAIATFVTNPVTVPVIYVSAYATGRSILPAPAILAEEAEFGWAMAAVRAIMDASAPTALGLALFAVASAVLGFVAVHIWWRLRVVQRWRTRILSRSAAGWSG